MKARLQKLWGKFRDADYRHAFSAADTSSTIAAQIETMRNARGWTQKDLADASDMAQSRISLLEDPSYDKMTLSTLRRIARAFDVGLSVKFVSFSTLARSATTVTPDVLAPPGFSEDFLLEDRATSVSFGVNDDDDPLPPVRFGGAGPAVKEVPYAHH